MKLGKKLLPLLLAAAICLTLAACGGGTQEQETTVSATLVNRSGRAISSVCITPSTDDAWGDNYLDEMLYDGDMLTVSLGTYAESELPRTWNILVYNDEDYILYDTEVDELHFEIQDGDFIVFLPPEGDVPIDITGEYDPADYGTPDPDGDGTELADISAYAGCWKAADEPFYFVISDDYEWAAINLYGEQVGPGYVVAWEDGVTLCASDGSELVSLQQNGDGNLRDADGSLLIASEAIMLLPTASDELSQTVYFPDSFSNISINYPIQMEAHAKADMDNTLSFNAIMEDGTDDYYSNIMVCFMPISGYDPYMSQGAAAAKPYMVNMLNDFLDGIFGGRVLKSLGTDFEDGGNYYGITGYVWLDSSIFDDGPSEPVRATMEVRYYGPTGYALIATAISLEHRIQNYFEICGGMLDTCTYDAGWSTAPKAVPSQPTYSGDTGDYGTAYYWYDEDGDIWYWNGYENEFIAFGSDGYIDSDSGQYMESNDAGWDYSDYYYDDYDPWSDPGDGWGDYGDYEDGWGDYFD